MRLVAKNGPLAGTSLALSDGLTIPTPDADADPARAGCTIRASAGGFSLQAADGPVEAFVNGLPVTTRRLEPHDQLRIGDSLFIVQDDEPAVPSTLTPGIVTVERTGYARAVLEVSADEALLMTARPTGRGKSGISARSCASLRRSLPFRTWRSSMPRWRD